VSEELENSLQQAIESYLGKRLGAIDEQLSRLQSDFDLALKGLRESAVGGSLDASPLSAAIFAHLQAARAQKLSGTMPDHGQAPSDISTIKRAIEEIERQQTHTEILGSLLKASAQFAERAALFVVRNDQAIGWRECEASDPSNLELIGGVSLPLNADTLLGRAAAARSTWSGAPGANSQDNLLTDQLGGNPQTAAALPLVVRDKVVAILYADSVSSDANALNLDALEMLTRFASMAVGLAAARVAPEKPAEAAKAAPVTETAAAAPEPVAAQPYEPETVYTPAIESQESEPNPEEPPVTSAAETVAPEHERESEPDYTSPTELPANTFVTEAAPERETEEVGQDFTPTEPAPVAAAEIAHDEIARTADETALVEAEPVPQVQAQPESQEHLETQPAQPQIDAPPEMAAPPPASVSFVSQYAAPLGGARRYGVSEPDLPIEVGEDERRLHNDARRFARLLVSEIKLYNEPKVKEGRSRSDIYDRLREDIDRSRQMYDKRVAPPVAARHDYFHQELVNTLAEGDAAKLGESYPGALVGAN
jgi:hypothetical protein